jgi:ABC-2 type transport system permease protein
MNLVRDTWLVFIRQVQLVLRNPVWVIVGIFQPLCFLLLFGPLLKGLPQLGGDNAYEMFVPGLLIQLAMFGSLFVGFALIAELRAGVIERMRVTPVSRLALLLGRCGRDVVSLLVQAAILILLALPFGLRVDLADLALTFAMLALIGLLFSAFSYGVALLVRSEDALAPLLNSVVIPVLLLSGILLPMTLAPAWLFALSRLNPFAYVVDAERAAFQGAVVSGTVGLGLAVAVGVAALTVAWGVRTFHRESA